MQLTSNMQQQDCARQLYVKPNIRKCPQILSQCCPCPCLTYEWWKVAGRGAVDVHGTKKVGNHCFKVCRRNLSILYFLMLVEILSTKTKVQCYKIYTSISAFVALPTFFLKANQTDLFLSYNNSASGFLDPVLEWQEVASAVGCPLTQAFSPSRVPTAHWATMSD